MSAYPRRISRGILKGQEFSSEHAYRKARGEAIGVSRYQQRKQRAQELGYSGYTERRRIRKEIGGKISGRREAKLLELTTNERERKVYAKMFLDFEPLLTDKRIAGLTALADETNVSVEKLYAIFYALLKATEGGK